MSFFEVLEQMSFPLMIIVASLIVVGYLYIMFKELF